LWLVSRDGKDAWKLVDLPEGYDHALTHAVTSPNGSRLANVRAYVPGGADQGGEVDGMAADGSTIAFYSVKVTCDEPF